jgi:hypothetical protein
MPTADSLSRMRTSTVPRSLVNPGRTSIFSKTPVRTTAPTPAPRTASTGGGTPIVSAYSGGGDSGGGGYLGGAPAVAAPPPRPSLRDFIDNDFGYRQAQDEYGDEGRRIREFDAETLRGRGETERDQGVRREALDQDLAGESIDVAEDLAGRGMLRSGGLAVEQGRVNRSGAQRRSAIDDLLTDFISQRGSGRVQQQQANRSALNDRINQLTQQYSAQYGALG